MANKNDRKRGPAIQRIAKDILRLEPLNLAGKNGKPIKDLLATANCDRFDFFDGDRGSLSIWNIRAALEAAYDAGRKSAELESTQEKPDPAR